MIPQALREKQNQGMRILPIHMPSAMPLRCGAAVLWCVAVLVGDGGRDIKKNESTSQLSHQQNRTCVVKYLENEAAEQERFV